MNVNLKTISHAQPSLNYPIKAYVIALVVIFAAAIGPITIRQTQLIGIPSLYIIAARLTLASLILAPIVFKHHRQNLTQLRQKDWFLVIGSGLMFALNLLFLFLALEYTSVLVTNVMRRTTPLWVIWLEIIFLGAIFTRSVWIGLGLTLAGSALVGFGSGGAIGAGSSPLWGTFLALVGSVSVGFYLLIGRHFSHTMPSLAYSWLVFTVAAVVTTMAVLITGIPLTGYGLEGYTWIIIVTVVTQFFGHVPMNLGLRYFPATHMSLILQVAVVVSAVLAFFAFDEIPSLLQIFGSVAIMAGVILVSRK